MRRALTAVAAALTLALGGGCGEPVELVALEVVPGDHSEPIGFNGWFGAYAVYSDGSTERAAEAELEWVSSNPSVVAVEASDGYFQVLAEGEAVITATYRGVNGSTTITGYTR
jgi:hypothetical protein